MASDAASTLYVSVAIGAALVALALIVYPLSHPDRFYNHFTWQAMAFLEGHTAIRYPVEATASSPGNWFFQDVLPVVPTDGIQRGLVPFPPLPALVLVPFVALWGLATDGQLVFAIVGAIDVGLAWWVLGRLPVRRWVRILTTLFLGFGTVLWYAAQIGTTWYQAHVLAVGLALAAIGVALGGDPDAARSEDDLIDAAAGVDGATVEPGRARRLAARLAWLVPDARQFLAGLLFGLACTSRLTVVFAAPFFVLVGSGGSWQRRGWSAALGAGIPIGLLVVYNVVSTGHLLHPGYQYLYELEATYYAPLNYHLDWSIEDVRYLPQNAAIMFLDAPVWLPDQVPAALGTGVDLCTSPGDVRGLFNLACPLLLPKDTGMSILLTSPAYLLGLPAVRWGLGRSRLISGVVVAVALIALVNLMHFSQGWVQFGYRFSLDFAPWAILAVALGMERIARRTSAGPRAGRSILAAASGWVSAWTLVALALALVLVSIVVNFWGVVWGDALGW